MTRGDSKYGEQALFSTISRKSYLFLNKVYKSDPKSGNANNKLTVWAACATTDPRNHIHSSIFNR